MFLLYTLPPGVRGNKSKRLRDFGNWYSRPLFSLLVHLCFLVHKEVQEKQEGGDEVGEETNLIVPQLQSSLLLPGGGGD